MRTNLECVRPCYGSGIAGEEMWHDEARQHVCLPSPGWASARLCASSRRAWRLWAA